MVYFQDPWQDPSYRHSKHSSRILQWSNRENYGTILRRKCIGSISSFGQSYST